MIDLLLRATAPVFEVDGTVRGELARDLQRLEVEETTAGLKTLGATFLAHGPRGGVQESLLYLDGEIFDFGRPLQVSIGPGEAARIVFQGPVSGIEADFGEGREPEVTVFAEDRLMQLRLTRRMKTYERMTDADIARAIGDEHSVGVEAAADGPQYDVVQQWNMSDLAFLRERARLIQAEVWIQDDTLHFKSRSARRATSLTLVRDTDLVELRVTADLAHQRTAVRVSGYDAQRRQHIDEEAGGSTVRAEASGGDTGPDILSRAFGARASYRVRDVPLVDQDARDWARAEMLRRSRRFVTAVGCTNGTADMVVGSQLTLEGVGTPFQGGGYYVTHVRHTYDLSNGHRTHFEAERPTIGGWMS